MIENTIPMWITLEEHQRLPTISVILERLERITAERDALRAKLETIKLLLSEAPNYQPNGDT